MNSSKNTDSTRFNDELSEALQLVSRQIDGDMVMGDTLRLEVLERQFSVEMAQFRSQCVLLHQNLSGLPQRAVSGFVFETCSAGSSDGPGRSIVPNRRLPMVVASIAAVLCGCLLVVFVKPSGLSDVGLTVATTNGVVEQQLATSDKAEMGESSSVDLQPLLSSENWNVVVVRVDQQDRDLAMQQIQTIVREHGLQLNDSHGNDKADWLGVILTSAVLDRDEVINDMEQELGEPSAPLTEKRVGNAGRQDIVDAVRKSFEFPTQSELHHGKVYLALPATEADVQNADPSPQQDLVADANVSAINSATSVESNSSSADLAARSATMTAENSVTLVVFEFVSMSDATVLKQKI